MVDKKQQEGSDLKLKDEALLRLFGALFELVVEDHDANGDKVREYGAADIAEGILG